MKENHENKAFQNERETKADQRGGNHNPAGANQYTEGRVDDRGRKTEPEAYQVLEEEARASQEPQKTPEQEQQIRENENR